MITNLQMPPSEKSKRLEGDHLSRIAVENDGGRHDGTRSFGISELFVFFGDVGARIRRLQGEEKGLAFSRRLAGFFLVPMETLHRGITWYAVARRTKKRKYASEAKKV